MVISLVLIPTCNIIHDFQLNSNLWSR